MEQAGGRFLRGCCFGRASIALDEYRDTIYPDLPKVAEDDGRWSGKGDPRCYQLLPGKTLGEALDLFVDYLSRPSAGRFSLREALNGAQWRLSLTSNEVARISLFEEGVTFNSFFQKPDAGLSTPDFVRSASFGLGVIEALADLWADTQRHRETPFVPASGRRNLRRHAADETRSQPELPTGTPENETAASVPARGSCAAVLGGRPREEPDGTTQSHLTRAREKAQSRFTSRAGRSHQHDRSGLHEPEPGDGGAYLTAA